MKNAALESPDLVRRRRQMFERLDGICPTPEILYSDITGVSVYRRESDDVIDCNGGKAMACFVVSGTKENHIGGRKYVYTEGECFVSSLCVPAFFHSVGASHEKPFISVGLQFEPEVIAELTKRDPIPHPDWIPDELGFVFQTPEPLADAFDRLTRLLEHPEDAQVLQPLVSREIHYWILKSPAGKTIRQLMMPGTRCHAITEAVQWIRSHYREPIRVNELSDRAHMSTSAFHRVFKPVTGLPPLQFVKTLRLYEAQRLMVRLGWNVSDTAAAVGNESSPQFIREYKRLFGEPPMKDVKRLETQDGPGIVRVI